MCIDLETGQIIVCELWILFTDLILKFILKQRKIKAHKDCIYQIVMKQNQLFSASEDGEVKLWDLRSSNGNSFTIKPFENEVNK